MYIEFEVEVPLTFLGTVGFLLRRQRREPSLYLR